MSVPIAGANGPHTENAATPNTYTRNATGIHTANHRPSWAAATWPTFRLSAAIAGATFAVPMFLGGGAGPVLPAWAWVLVKTVVLLGVLVWLRRRLPAFRPDKFMEVGWMVLLPAVLLQDLVVAVVAVWRS